MSVIRKPLLLAGIALFVAMSTTASAQDGDGAAPSMNKTPKPTEGLAMVADIVLARPVGLGVCAVGTAVFLVGLPFAAMVGDVSTPAQRLVGDPARYTFTRPLGHFQWNPERDGRRP